MLNTAIAWILLWFCVMAGAIGLYLVIDAIQRFVFVYRIRRFQRRIAEEFKNDKEIIKK